MYITARGSKVCSTLSSSGDRLPCPKRHVGLEISGRANVPVGAIDVQPFYAHFHNLMNPRFNLTMLLA